MDDQERAFLQAICADPLDLTARLAYCDWLDEHSENSPCWCKNGLVASSSYGENYTCTSCHGTGFVPDANGLRSEFIRCQIELATLPPVSARSPGVGHLQKSERFNTLRLRERELWWANGCQWMFRLSGQTQEDVRDGHHNYPAMSGSIYGSGHESHFSRVDQDCLCGFIEQVALSWADWATHATAIRAAAPIRVVKFSDQVEWLCDENGFPNRMSGFWLLGCKKKHTYDELRLGEDDCGQANKDIQGDPWRRHVARRLLKAEYGDKIKFNLP